MEPFLSDYLNSIEVLFGDFAGLFEGLPQEALDWTPGPRPARWPCWPSTLPAPRAIASVKSVSARSPRATGRRSLQPAAWTPPGCKPTCNETVEHARQSLRQLTMEDLPRMRPMPGRGMEVTISQALLQALEHANQHLGHAQLTLQMWQQRGR